MGNTEQNHSYEIVHYSDSLGGSYPSPIVMSRHATFAKAWGEWKRGGTRGEIRHALSGRTYTDVWGGCWLDSEGNEYTSAV